MTYLRNTRCHPEREAVEGSPLHQQRKPTQETEA
jgi:hypothetical protein